MAQPLFCILTLLYILYLQGQRRWGAVDLELLLEAGSRRGRRRVGRVVGGGQRHHASSAVLSIGLNISKTC